MRNREFGVFSPVWSQTGIWSVPNLPRWLPGKEDENLTNTYTGQKGSYLIAKVGHYSSNTYFGPSQGLILLKKWFFGQIRAQNGPGEPPVENMKI